MKRICFRNFRLMLFSNKLNFKNYIIDDLISLFVLLSFLNQILLIKKIKKPHRIVEFFSEMHPIQLEFSFSNKI